MRIEIEFDDQDRPRRIVSTDSPAADTDATDAGEPRLAEAATAALPQTAEDAGPPAVAMDHPLVPPLPAPANAEAGADHDGGAAPQFG